MNEYKIKKLLLPHTKKDIYILYLYNIYFIRFTRKATLNNKNYERNGFNG